MYKNLYPIPEWQLFSVLSSPIYKDFFTRELQLHRLGMNYDDYYQNYDYEYEYDTAVSLEEYHNLVLDVVHIPWAIPHFDWVYHNSERDQHIVYDLEQSIYTFYHPNLFDEVYVKELIIEMLHRILWNVNLNHHKSFYYHTLKEDLHKYLHKKWFNSSLREELIQVTWNPSRFFEWCLDNDEKRHINTLFRI